MQFETSSKRRQAPALRLDHAAFDNYGAPQVRALVPLCQGLQKPSSQGAAGQKSEGFEHSKGVQKSGADPGSS